MMQGSLLDYHLEPKWFSSIFYSLFYQVEDDVNVSECELQDISVIPLLNALHTHQGVALLDLSHNLLGDNISFYSIFQIVWML